MPCGTAEYSLGRCWVCSGSTGAGREPIFEDGGVGFLAYDRIVAGLESVRAAERRRCEGGRCRGGGWVFQRNH